MTSGERAVWAAEFVRAIGDDVHASVCARRASDAVRLLRDEGTTMLARAGDSQERVTEDRAMLADMLSTGADR